MVCQNSECVGCSKKDKCHSWFKYHGLFPTIKEVREAYGTRFEVWKRARKKFLKSSKEKGFSEEESLKLWRKRYLSFQSNRRKK